MGLFSHRRAPSATSSPATLEPQNPPLGALPQFVVSQGMVIDVVKDTKMGNAGDFSVVDQKEGLVLRSDAKRWSMSNKRVICDASGTSIFQLAHKSFTSGLTYAASEVGGNEREWYRVKSSSNRDGFSLRIEFPNASTSTPGEVYLTTDLAGNGTFTSGRTGAGGSFGIVNWHKNQTGGTAYSVHVAPGVDLALISTAVMVLDAAKNEPKGKTPAAL